MFQVVRILKTDRIGLGSRFKTTSDRAFTEASYPNSSENLNILVSQESLQGEGIH